VTPHLFLDFETRSEIDLEVRGLHNYATHPSTRVLLLAYALNKEEPKLWQADIEPFPAELSELLDDPFVHKVSWNAGFERSIFRYVLKRDIPIPEWLDPSIWARHVSIPGSLADACEVLGLSDELAKMGEGARLIDKFCSPATEAQEDTLYGRMPAVFRDRYTDPEDWKLFCSYCLQDVKAEREILRKLMIYPLPRIEQQGWCVDQIINERGIPIDPLLVENALHIAEQTKDVLLLRMKKIAGLDNANSRSQLLAWAQQHGYPFKSMGKQWIERALAGNKIDDDCREVFELRQQAGKTSASKLQAIRDIVNEDGRVRGQFNYLGSSRAGRWSGRDIQPHNLPRPVSKDIEKRMDLAVELLRGAKFDRIKAEFSNEIDVVTSCIRAAFRAQPGKKFLISDLSAIENRGIGWICSCKEILEVFEKGLDPYIDFATKMFKVPYDKVTKDQRQTAKPAVLGAGYRLSGGEEGEDRFGNAIKTGLWGYCLNYGVEMTREDAHFAVDVFREEYDAVVNFWYALENVSHAVVRGQKATELGPLVFEMCHGVLMIHLPSGRRLHYIDPRIENREFYGKMKPTLIYKGRQQQSKAWVDITTHGGKLLENVTQAISRDFLLNGMMEAERRGLPIVLHVHDELVAEVDEDSPLTYKDLEACMEVRPKWAPQFPLKSAGFESVYYKKG
jgi:DNA polymerase